MQVFCIMVILRDHKKLPGDDLGFSVPGFEQQHEHTSSSDCRSRCDIRLLTGLVSLCLSLHCRRHILTNTIFSRNSRLSLYATVPLHVQSDCQADSPLY